MRKQMQWCAGVAGACLALGAVAAPTATGPHDPFGRWLPDTRVDEARIEQSLMDAIDPQRLARWHEMVSSEPHVAGTPGDGRVVEKLVKAFTDMGLDVEKQELWLYLARPISAKLELVSPVSMSLAIKEKPIDEDPYSKNPNIMIGWNAYSGSGDVTAEVVYANYGTKEDFEKLKEMGVDVAGKIVIARYGGNFRGYKAKYAEEAGAVGLVIYSDPKNVGYGRGLMYPEGGWATPDEIQRGSILTLPWEGDPLTPYRPATKDAERLDPATVALPKIPVQPVGWGAAQEILSRMRGRVVPEKWQGGLPFNYHMTGGADGPVVHLNVQQERKLRRTWNVVGTLRGAVHPEEKMIIGCHHDAWSFGAADPNSGTIVVLEAAKVLSERAAMGDRPARSIVFANWAAEEYGLLGSVEWVEANRADLIAHAIGYINLDEAVMGSKFGSSSAPTLKTVIRDVARAVPSVANPDKTVFDEWSADDSSSEGAKGKKGATSFGNLGGGSDHLGFYSYAGVPSASLGAHGASGTSYHSAFDNLHWWRKIVGDDYKSAQMVTRMTSLVAWRLANSSAIELDPVQYALDTRTHLREIEKRAAKLNVAIDVAPAIVACDSYEVIAQRANERLATAIQSGSLSTQTLDSVNMLLLTMERLWLYEPGLPGLPWFKNLYAMSDPTSGYAAWMLPMIRQAVEAKNAAAAAKAVTKCADIIEKLGEMCQLMESMLPADQTKGESAR